MSRLQTAIVGVLALVVTGFGVAAHAQQTSLFNRQVTSVGDPKPRNDLGGYTGSAMRSIYRSDIGDGYTIKSLNSLALDDARAKVPYVGQSSAARPYSGDTFGVAAARTGKPFSNVMSTPTVSPYMNLFREDLSDSGDFNYQTLVRPQLQQLQTNTALERQQIDLARRVQSISAQSAYKNPAGSEQQYPTGHKSVFMYHGGYYPAVAPRKR